MIEDTESLKREGMSAYKQSRYAEAALFYAAQGVHRRSCESTRVLSKPVYGRLSALIQGPL